MLTHESMEQQFKAEIEKMLLAMKTQDYIDGFAHGVEFITKMIVAAAEKENEERRAIFRARFEKLNLREIFGEEKK